jgi:alginate O-acetyltransferase complex protein AlgI
MLTGIWHGANWNFLGWGLYYGLILLGEKMIYGDRLQRAPAPLQHIYTMFIVMIGWFIFSLPDISSGPAYFLSLFGRAGFAGGESVYLLVTNAVLLLILILGSLDLPARAAGMLLTRFENHDWICILLRGAFYVFIFVLSVAFLVDASYNPFLYFRF